MAEAITSYAFSARAAHISEKDIQRVIAGYLEQVEIAVRGAMDLEKMPRLHPLQIRDFLRANGYEEEHPQTHNRRSTDVKA